MDDEFIQLNFKLFSFSLPASYRYGIVNMFFLIITPCNYLFFFLRWSTWTANYIVDIDAKILATECSEVKFICF